MKFQRLAFGLISLLAVFVSVDSLADEAGKHPYYLHALSDLRIARWQIERRPADAGAKGHEENAIAEIDAAIQAIKHAAIDDGKDLHDHPNLDLPPDHIGRMQKALEILHKVRSDLAHEEDDDHTRGLRDLALKHVDGAIRETEVSIGR